MPAKSKSQQRFFGMVDAYKKGELENPSPEIKKAAKSMTKKEIKKFAKTKHDGLPNHVDEEQMIRDLVNEVVETSLKSIFSNDGHYDGNNPIHQKLRRSFDNWYNSFAKSYNVSDDIMVDMLRGAIDDIEYGEL